MMPGFSTGIYQYLQRIQLIPVFAAKNTARLTKLRPQAKIYTAPCIFKIRQKIGGK